MLISLCSWIKACYNSVTGKNKDISKSVDLDLWFLNWAEIVSEIIGLDFGELEEEGSLKYVKAKQIHISLSHLTNDFSAFNGV